MKKTQQATQTQTAQQQALTQTKKGGEAMNKEQTQIQQQAQIYFVTFPSRVSPEIAKEVVTELRKRFPQTTFIFTPRPVRGRKFVIDVDGQLVIITIPYTLKKNPKEQAPQETPKQEQAQEGGFTLRELIKNIKT